MDIQEVKERSNIVEVVGRYVTLKRKGKSYTGLCPFHTEKHPSFSVDPVTRTFKCFSCGKQGDVITFIREKESCSFTEALERLGHQTESRPVKPEHNFMKPPEAPPVVVPHHEEFLKCLMNYTTGDEPLTLMYHRFEVGRSPHLVPQPWYNQRNRLVFPIRDSDGVLRGFSARNLDPACKEAKYIHTAASQGFRSSEILYGLHRAKKQIYRTGKVYLVEGFKDALAMHAAGIENCVAIMGTQLSARQIALLSENAHTVFLVLDADNPGKEAAGKLSELLLKSLLVPEVIRLPDGDDPDSFYHREGGEALSTWIREASIRPHFIEKQLIVNCLLHPYIQLGELTFAVKTSRLLHNLMLPFASPLHNELLELAARTYRDDNDAQRIDHFLDRMKKDQKAAPFLHFTWKKHPDPGQLQHLLNTYLEFRMVERIREITREITYPADGVEQEKLWREMSWRKSELEYISNSMGRAGAVY